MSIFTIVSCATNTAVTTVNDGGVTNNDRSAQSDNNQAQSADSSVNSGDITSKEWTLLELRKGSATISIERLSQMGTSFTIKFDEDRVSGVGAPNRYFSSYTRGQGNALSIRMVGASLMAPLFELETLKEHEYFGYLSNVKSWNIRDGKLELYTSDENGAQVVLVYN